jgi:hypothetical protein
MSRTKQLLMSIQEKLDADAQDIHLLQSKLLHDSLKSVCRTSKIPHKATNTAQGG